MNSPLVNNYSGSFQYQLLKLAWDQYKTSPSTVNAACLSQLKKQAKYAQKIIKAVLSSDAAQKHQVIKKEVDYVVNQLIEQFDNQESFELSLLQQRINTAELQQAVYEDLLCDKIIATKSSDYLITTEQEAMHYYQKNKEKFKHPERRRVSHILITVNDDYLENKRQKAFDRISLIQASLLSEKANFAELALANSECPTALNHGMIGPVSVGQLHSALDNVLFNMESNTLSTVIESEIGFHLLYCHEILPAFDTHQQDALNEITKQLNQHRKSKQAKKWLSSLLKR